MDYLAKHIEALIFCSQEALTVDEIQGCLSELYGADISADDINAAIVLLIEKFQSDNYTFEIVKSAGGFQFLTKPAFQNTVSILLKQKSRKKMSASALETLSIIAYKQDISKHEIEQIRGVNCDYTIQKLLERELIEIKGKADTVGRPILYGTTKKFMDYFGINDLKELPELKDFTNPDNQIGEENESV